MAKIIEVENLTYAYGDGSAFVHDAISDLSFSIEKGEILGIIGHTGSGKSTLVQQLNGLLKPTSGRVLFDGKDIWENPKEIRKVRFQIGLVFQYPEYQLFEETVFADIAFGPKNMGLSGDELTERVKEICSVIGIPESYFETSPFDLSGGEKRRVAIAGVMAMRPQVLILDEPIAGLDPKGRRDVVNMVAEYRKAYDATVLIISHNMEDMAMLADKLLVLNDGKLLMYDETRNVFSKPEVLREAGLNVPIVTRVFEELKAKGYDVPTDIFTVDEAVTYLSNRKAGGSRA
ncbi:MAG: energy-coupling factor transporter ATPase [Clostridia bacterium]|nr:energy-coupling factor transporter ATPase [Clostridia bacterium]